MFPCLFGCCASDNDEAIDDLAHCMKCPRVQDIVQQSCASFIGLLACTGGPGAAQQPSAANLTVFDNVFVHLACGTAHRESLLVLASLFTAYHSIKHMRELFSPASFPFGTALNNFRGTFCATCRNLGLRCSEGLAIHDLISGSPIQGLSSSTDAAPSVDAAQWNFLSDGD